MMYPQLALKSLHLLLTDILTVAQVAVVSYQTIPQYWCRMQLAKVVITSALVLAACAEGPPEGRDCVLKCISDVALVQV